MNDIVKESSQNTPIMSAQIDSSIAIKLCMGAKMANERSLMSRADVWHKIRIIRGAQYDKEIVLKAILKAVEPSDLIPVRYQIYGEDAYFIARNCSAALDKLCKTSLIIKNFDGDVFILMITLGFAPVQVLKVNIQPLLLTALTKRYNPNLKTLNLENFHKDPDIAKTVYCPLSQLRISNHVLKLAKTAIATFKHLNLQRNELFNISAIENSELTSIKFLDLRHNLLMNMNALAPLKSLNIIKLWLDGNPLCENYSDAKKYVKSVRRYCPHLQELDGVIIRRKMPFIYRDNFSDNETQHFVYKFASHFFTLYDQLDRSVLRGLYHNHACYSMSFAISNVTAAKMNLQQYVAQNRNLLRKTPKKNVIFHYGQEDILLGLNKLPRSYHDKSSFKYDVMYNDGNYLVVCISGLFKKLTPSMNVLSFSRTFVLSATVDDEYVIMNDQYHIEAAPVNITPDKITVKVSFDEIMPICFSPSEKAVLITRMTQITTMSDEWSEIYLKGANWDMRKALTQFMKDYKTSSVSEQAFRKTQ